MASSYLSNILKMHRKWSKGQNLIGLCTQNLKPFGMKLMMSDGVHAKELQGNNLALSLVTDDTATQEQIFERLEQGGRVMMPLADTFWGARFGKVEDKFGIRWMIHCDSMS